MAWECSEIAVFQASSCKSESLLKRTRLNPGRPASWQHFRELRLFLFLLFLSPPSRKTSVYPIAHSTVIHDSVKVPNRAQKVQVGRVRHPLSLSTTSISGLWTLGQAGTTPVVFHRRATSCCSSGHRGGHAAGCLGEETGQALTVAPFPPSDAGDMIEMQGFGPSLPAWHLQPLCSQGSSCLSCSTSSSPYAPPSHCSCVPDR